MLTLNHFVLDMFPEKTMQVTPHDRHICTLIGDRPTYNQLFADNIDVMNSRNDEQQESRIDSYRARTYGMEVATERSKIMTNSTNNMSLDISINGQKLEEVISFKYLGATLCKDGTYSADIRIRIASGMAAMTGLNRSLGSNTINFVSKCKL